MEPPVPIPNTEVKRPSADDTEGVTPCGKYATARRLCLSRIKAKVDYPLTIVIGCFIINLTVPVIWEIF